MAKITVTKTKTRVARSRAAKPAAKKSAGKKAIPAMFKKKGK